MQTLQFGYGAKGLAADKLDFSYFSIFQACLRPTGLQSHLIGQEEESSGE